MSIFEEVKEQLNIQQVIESYGIRVNRAHQFVCPFHNDHKPSASIKNDYFNCFVCGAGGDLITFTAKYLGLSNLEAAKELIRTFNLNIDTGTDREWDGKQNAIEKKRKEEVKKCSTFRDKYYKDKEIRSELKKPTLYKLRNEVRQSNKRKEQEAEAYVHYAGCILADMHRFLWQGIQMYPFEHERHISGLQGLTVCEYYLDCYDKDALEFVKIYWKVVDDYDKKLHEECKSDF